MHSNDLDLAGLLPSWDLALRAAHRSPATIKTYRTGVRLYLAWCDETGRPAVLDRSQVTAWIAGLLDAGAEPTTAQTRLQALRQLGRWLTEEGEVPTDPLAGVRRPKMDVKIVEPLTEVQLRALLKACTGTAFRERRDEALIRLMTETGMRSGEVLALTVDDVDLAKGTAIVRRGKGGKGRTVPFGPQTARAVDRYMRLRRHHPLAETPSVWLGERGKALAYDGLLKTLKYRARLASIEGFHPHRLRHTAAHRWLAAGGSEGGLMAVAGWTRPDMLVRYSRAQAETRAADEARRLSLGDL